MAPLRIGYTSDADDAFMFFGWVRRAVGNLPRKAVFHTEDIEALNQRAMAGEMDMTLGKLTSAKDSEAGHHL